MAEGKWTKVGEIPVDTGTVVIADPCALVKESEWEQWHERLSATSFFGEPGHDPAMLANDHGVEAIAVSSTGSGDGWFPVEARVLPDGRVAELRVRFLDDDGNLPGMAQMEAEAQAQHDRDHERLLAADRANVEKYGRPQ